MQDLDDKMMSARGISVWLDRNNKTDHVRTKYKTLTSYFLFTLMLYTFYAWSVHMFKNELR